MRKAGHFFPEQHTDEKIVLFTRRHWIVYFESFFYTVILIAAYTAALFFLRWQYPDFFEDDYLTYIYVASAIVGMIALLKLFTSWVDYYLDVWIITNERIVEIKQNALFNRQISELEIEDIEDVSAKVVGIWGTFLGYGTIFVQTAGATDMFEFMRIPRPYEIQKQLLRIKTLYEDKTRKEISELIHQPHTGIKKIKPLVNYIDEKVISNKKH